MPVYQYYLIVFLRIILVYEVIGKVTFNDWIFTEKLTIKTSPEFLLYEQDFCNKVNLTSVNIYICNTGQLDYVIIIGCDLSPF